MGKKFYTVREGFSVKLPDRPDVYVAGGVLELDEEVAKQHAHKLEPISDDAQKAFDHERAAAAEEAVRRDTAADEARQAALEAEAKAAQDAADKAAAAAAAAAQ